MRTSSRFDRQVNRFFREMEKMTDDCSTYDEAYEKLEQYFKRMNHHSEFVRGCHCSLCTARDKIEESLMLELDTIYFGE